MLPVLIKELTEAAHRQRTYWIRTAFCVVLFSVFLAMSASLLYDSFSSPNVGPSRFSAMRNVSYSPRFPQLGDNNIVGTGKRLFDQLFITLMVSVLVMVPALFAPAITAEKEKRTLALLFLTKLNPWTILVQKIGSRLVWILTLFLVSAPLTAVLYSTGGVSITSLWTNWVVLISVTLMLGSASIMFSAYCRHTVSAVTLSYLFTVSFFLLSRIYPLTLPGNLSPIAIQLMFTAFVSGLALIFLGLARFFLVRRAFLRKRNPWRATLKLIDTFWEQVNDRLAGGVTFFKTADTLSSKDPITWLERNTKGFGNPRYVWRMVLLVGAPVIVGMSFVVRGDMRMGDIRNGTMVVQFAIWMVTVLMLATIASRIVSAERERRTLELLMSTPLPAKDVIQQKIRIVSKITWISMVPIVILEIFQFACVAYGYRRSSYGLFVLGFPFLTWIYFQLIIWICCWIGLVVKKPMKAMVAALATVAVLHALPLAAFLLFQGKWHEPRDLATFAQIFVPIDPVAVYHYFIGGPWKLRRYFGYNSEITWAVKSAALFLYLPLLLYFRHRCLKYADHHLGRPSDLSPPWWSRPPIIAGALVLMIALFTSPIINFILGLIHSLQKKDPVESLSAMGLIALLILFTIFLAQIAIVVGKRLARRDVIKTIAHKRKPSSDKRRRE